MKDIFIDNDIAKNFTNPLDPEYKKLIAWLLKDNKNSPQNNAYLVLSKKIINEYNRSARNAHTDTCISTIINQIIKEGRHNSFTNQQIKDFQKIYFKKRIINKLRSNSEDRNHIPIVLLSNRKCALTLDKNFKYDLEHFPGFTVTVAYRPQDISYE